MSEPESPAGVPAYLTPYEVVGRVEGHVVLQVEPRIYVYWLVGHFTRAHLDQLTAFAVGSRGWGHPYASITFTEAIAGYDADLRTVVTDPGELRAIAATEAIVVTNRALERMVVNTMALAGRAAGNPGGRLSAARDFTEALGRARAVLGSAGL